MRDAPGLDEIRARLQIHEGVLQDSDLDGVCLLLLCFADDEENARISALARARCLPVNVHMRAHLSSFIVPSIIDRSPVLVAVSTGGVSPSLARIVRARLELLLPNSYGALARLAGDFNVKVRERLREPLARRRFWEQVFDGPIAEMVHAGREQAARLALHEAIDNTHEYDGSRGGSPDADGARMQGEVYLVGAGPGDPDLLTFRALRLVQRADVVVYDRLVSAQVLALTRRDASRIYAGKARNRHTMPQENINELLVRLAKEGKRVLRLKGGDPFTFARGGEEIETLAAEGVPFQVVPGISAANGCAAYAGIPLTHRDFAQACVFVTGHLRDGSVDLNWNMLAQPRQTIVIYMGLHGLPVICKELIAHGLPASMPAALIQQGTTRHQRVFTATLETLSQTVAQAGGAQAPTLIIVGEVVALRDKLNWFEPAAASAELALLRTDSAGPAGDDSGDA
jgi:uroporphyrin-III C-methyltransferase/precorrin-2 dehydrogenase/sirohydrochlorin ferrochelatase